MPRRASAAPAVAGAGLAAALTFAADPAPAAYTAQVSNGTLQVTGNGATDAPALRLAPGDPQTLHVGVDTLDGFDTVIVGPGVTDPITPVVDLGAGQ